MGEPMRNDLFARAKGPRRVCGDWVDPCTLGGIHCPWCGTACDDAPKSWLTTEGIREHAVVTCPDCSREFMCPDENGVMACVGLQSPADVKYLAARAAARGEG